MDYVEAGANRDNPLRIVVADDFAEWRVRVHSILKPNPNLQVIADAGNGLEAVQKVSALSPDVVLLDIGMPVLNGIEAAIHIRQASPETKIVFLTQENDAEIRTAALDAGADGFLLKANAAQELLSAIETAFGDRYHPSSAGREPQLDSSLLKEVTIIPV